MFLTWESLFWHFSTFQVYHADICDFGNYKIFQKGQKTDFFFSLFFHVAIEEGAQKNKKKLQKSGKRPLNIIIYNM